MPLELQDDIGLTNKLSLEDDIGLTNKLNLDDDVGLFSEEVGIQPLKTLKEGTKDVARSTLQFVKGSEESRDLEKEASRFGISGKAGPLQSLMTDQARQDIINARAQGKTDIEGLESGQQQMLSDIQSAIDSKWLKSDKTLKRPEGFKGYVQDVIKMAPQIVAQIGATATTGPVGGGAFMATQIGGSHYDKLIKKGVDPERAFKASVSNAVMQAPLEQIGMAKAFNAWKPNRIIGKRLKAAGEAGFVGWLTETLQKYPELAADIWAKGERLDLSEKVDQFLEGSWQAFKEGAYEGAVAAPFEALLGGATVGVNESQKTETIKEEINKEPVVQEVSPEASAQIERRKSERRQPPQPDMGGAPVQIADNRELKPGETLPERRTNGERRQATINQIKSDDIRDAIDSQEYGVDEYEVYGLRVMSKTPEGESVRVDVGDNLGDSYSWPDGEPSDEMLRGASAVKVDVSNIDDAIKKLDDYTAINEHEQIVLVGGNNYGWGNDAYNDEILIRDGKVIKIWEYNETGSSEVRERRVNIAQRQEMENWTPEQIAGFRSARKNLEDAFIAWHGSPYKFKKFSTDKIGTGEGQKSFGWGLYFTDKKSIAKHYAKKLSRRSGDTGPMGTAARLLDAVGNNKDDAIKELNERISKAGPNTKDFKLRMRKAIEYIENGDVDPVIYKATLHEGKDPSEYTWLDWDKKVPDEYFPKILKQLEKEGLSQSKIYGSIKDKSYDVKGTPLDIQQDGEALYAALSEELGGDKQASLSLQRAGIGGIRYQADTLGGKGKTEDRGTNYVVFDENAVTIKKITDLVGNEIGSSELINDILNKGAEIIEGFPEAKNKAMESMERSANEVIYWMADKNHPLQTVQKKLNKVSEDIDVFMKETQRPKIVAAKIKQAWDEDIKPFIEETAKSKKTLNQIEEYAHAMHAPEANQALRLANAKRYYDSALEILNGDNKLDAKLAVKNATEPIQWSIALDNAFKTYPELSELKNQWEKFSEKPSGMTDEDAEKIIESNKGDKDIERLRQMLARINRKRIDILNEAGLIPSDEYEIIRDKYDYYVPLMREGYNDALYGSSRGLKPSGKPIKARGGSSREVVNIVANSIANLEKAINMAEKARSTRSLYNLVKSNPNPDFWRIKEVNKSPRHDAYGNIRMYPNLFDVSDNEFRFMVDGKQHLLEVDRDNRDAMLMIRTLKSDDASMGWVLNQFARLNRILARINTSWSPEFIVSNFIRDFQTAGINLNDTDVKGKKFFSGTKNAVRAIWRSERGKQNGSEYEKMYERFKMAGGKIGWSDVHQTVENLSKKISREIKMESGKAPIRKTIKEWGDFIEAANTSVENGVRLHVFRLAVDQGMTDEKAAQIASDITVDFTKKGAAGPVINSLYLFANAGIQGSYRIIRAAMKSKKVWRIMAGIFAAGFLNGMLNSWAGEDDDGEDYFNKIDDFERERNAIFMLPGTKGKYAKLPLPWGYNFFWNLGVESSRAFTKEKYDYMNGAGRLTSIFFNAFNPVASGTLLQTLAPTIADPFVMVGENKTWFGGELMPEQNKFSKVPTPDSQRYWRSARTSSKYVAEKLNELTGGDKVKSGAIDVSPETLDLILDTAGGSAMRFFTDIGAIPEKAMKGEKIEMRKIPFIRRVAGEQTEWTNSRIYYENLQDVLTAKERLKAYRGTAEYKNILSETKKQRQLFNTAKATEKRLKKLRKQLKSARANNNKKAEKNIKDRMDKLYINFNRIYNKK